MSNKYYISDRMFFQGIDLNNFWIFFMSYLKNIDDYIIITRWLPTKEFEVTKELFCSTSFQNVSPEKIFISQKPYLVTEKSMYLCEKYKLNKNIYKIISNNWLKELQEENICPTFVIKHKDSTEFMLTNNNIIAKLTFVELKTFNKFGFNFKQWNIKLNNIL